MPMPTYQLIVRRGPKAGDRFVLNAQTIIVGRDSTADITINDPEVSRNHCRLILDNTYLIQDLGSTNGTFVDGQRLGGEPTRLVDGQIIQLGSNVSLLYHEGEGEVAGGPGDLEALIGRRDPGEEQSQDDADEAAGEPSTPSYLENLEKRQTIERPASELEPLPVPVPSHHRPPQYTPDLQTGNDRGEKRRLYLTFALILIVSLICCAIVTAAALIYYLRSQGMLQTYYEIHPLVTALL